MELLVNSVRAPSFGGRRQNMTSWARDWSLKTPALFRVVAALFIAVSTYFAFTPISKQFGEAAAYVYGIVGIGLIVVLFVSLRLKFEDQRLGAP
jgi:hypothetical protein